MDRQSLKISSSWLFPESLTTVGAHTTQAEDADTASYHFKPETDIINSLAITKNGRYIKSTTFNYVGEDDSIYRLYNGIRSAALQRM